jgi:hypothetical protein
MKRSLATPGKRSLATHSLGKGRDFVNSDVPTRVLTVLSVAVAHF